MPYFIYEHPTTFLIYMTISKSQATWLGCVAIFLWAIDTVINVKLARIPVAEVLGMAWGLCFLLYALVLSYRKEWHKVEQNPLMWLIGSLGICAAHCLMVAALRYGPSEQIITIGAMWPIFVVIIGGWLLQKQRLSLLTVIGVLIGFFGVFIVITDGKLLEGFHLVYVKGYVLALLSAFLWTAYVILTRKFAHLSSEMIGMYLGVGALFALAYHFAVDDFVKPNLEEGLLIAIKGCVTLAASYFCWDYGIKRGNFALLNTLAYFNPILSISFLMLSGLAYAMMPIWIGASFVVIGALLCREKQK